MLRRVGHHRGNGFLVRHIGDRRDRLAAVALDLGDHLVGLRFVRAHVDDDRGATRREGLGHRAADIAACARHERDAA